MKECLECGKVLPPRPKGRGQRERDYCSDRCRQRACRRRNKDKHDLDRMRRELDERMLNAIYQDIHRETWQDELEAERRYANFASDLLSSANEEIKWLRTVNETLREVLEDQEAEIARLNYLLDAQSKKKRT